MVNIGTPILAQIFGPICQWLMVNVNGQRFKFKFEFPEEKYSYSVLQFIVFDSLYLEFLEQQSRKCEELLACGIRLSVKQSVSKRVLITFMLTSNFFPYLPLDQEDRHTRDMEFLKEFLSSLICHLSVFHTHLSAAHQMQL